MRTYTTRITLVNSYSTPPTISVSLGGFSTYHGTNPVIFVYPENVTNDGFDLVFTTWSDSLVYGASASWIAYGTR